MNQDIRQWAKDNGWGVSDRGPISAVVKEAYAASNGEGPPEVGEAEAFLITPESPSEAPPPPAPPVAERKPTPVAEPRKGIFQRKPPVEGKPLGKPGPKQPRKPLPRVSTETLIGGAYSVAGSIVGRREQMVPVSRVMMFQSPTVGVIGDEAIKGTWVDRVLQPLARAGEKGEIVAAIVGPPAIVGFCTAYPEMFPVCQPVLKMLLASYLQLSEPAMAKIQKRMERMESNLGGADLDEMIASIFAGTVPGDAVPSSQEEANIRKARGEA